MALPRKKNRRAAAVATLPDDVVLEILACVADDDDLTTLFRCAVACKPWRTLVANPSFLRRRWPEGARHPSSFLGLFGRPWRCPRARIDGPPGFIPAPRSPLDPRRRFPGSFGACTRGLLNMASPLASRQGLLLVHLMQPGRGARLAVCDMFAGTCDILPLLDGCVYFDVYGSAILTDADCGSSGQQSSSLSSYSTSFNKVLIIGRDISEYGLYTLSSAESAWSRLPTKCFRLEGPISVTSEGVVCRGKVHWLVCNKLSFYTLEFSIETGHVRLTKLPLIQRRQHEPSFYSSLRLAVTVDGNLSFLCLRWRSLKLRIWTCQGEKGSSGNGALDWVRTKMFKLPKKTCGEGTQGSAHWLRRLECMWVGEKSGTLFVTGDRKLKYIVNTETRAIEEVPTQFWNLRKHNIVPFEMDWPAFFMSRLEAKRKE